MLRKKYTTGNHDVYQKIIEFPWYIKLNPIIHRSIDLKLIAYPSLISCRTDNMKFVILLCVLSALLLQIEASPLQRLSRSERAVSRQQAVNNEVAPAVAPASEDDDDDDDEDDDDEPDLGDLIDDDEGRSKDINHL